MNPKPHTRALVVAAAIGGALCIARTSRAQATRDTLVAFLADETRQAAMVESTKEGIDAERERLAIYRRGKVTGINASGNSDNGPYWTFQSRESKQQQIEESEASIEQWLAALKQPLIALPRLEVRALKGGAIGEVPYSYGKVIQVIDPQNALVEIDDILVWLAGISTSDMADGRGFKIHACYEVTGTKRYNTAAGATRTVFVIKPYDASADIAKARSIIEDRKFRTWSDSTGEFTVEAKFLEFKASKVHLAKRDGKELSVPMTRLSDTDQEWVREHLRDKRR